MRGNRKFKAIRPMKLPRFIRKDQVLKMLSKAANDRDELLMKIMFYCGLRCSEALSLTTESFDYTDGTLYVVRGKGGKDRIVPIPAFLLQEIMAYTHKKTGKLFNIGARHTRRIVKQAAIDAGVPNPDSVHPHTLRHSYATYLYNNGVDLLSISRFLGHSDINMTTIYTHLGTKRGKEIIDKVF